MSTVDRPLTISLLSWLSSVFYRNPEITLTLATALLGGFPFRISAEVPTVLDGVFWWISSAYPAQVVP